MTMCEIQSSSFKTLRRHIADINHGLLPKFVACLLAVAATAGIPTATMATEAASPWVDTEYASVRLITSTKGTGTDTSTSSKPAIPLTMGLEFQLADNWKIYWRSPGDAGFPPQPDWTASENVDVIDMTWPAPVRFSVLGFETLGYKDEVVFPLTVVPVAPGRPVKIAGTIDYLICSDICVPETVDLALSIPSGEKSPSTFAHLINKHAVRVPSDGEAHGLRVASLALSNVDPAKPVLTVSVSSFLDIPFHSPDAYLEGPEGLGYGAPDVSLHNDGFEAQLRVPVYPNMGVESASLAELASASFTVTIVDGERSAEKKMTATISDEQQQLPPEALDSVTDSGLLFILGLAFLGGLILNLMPCVLPVLSIKLLGLVGHGGSEARTVRLSFLSSAAGIIVSFLIIGSTLAALKSAGATIGWGIQFQQPWFLASMMVVIIIFACNLWGWFEFRLPSVVANVGIHANHTHGMGSHFLTGMLATLLATPCSAPFLGTAVGFALARETPEILAVFATLGLGLAAPYILIAAVPKMATMLPRPGAWMIGLRRFLGLALAGTAGWLLWVLSQQVGLYAAGISGACAIGLIITIYLRQRLRAELPINTVLSATALGIFAIAVPILAGLPELGATFGNRGTQKQSVAKLDSLWQSFNQTNIDVLVSAGNVVFVDVTADWCITCQVNKSFVLAENPVMSALQSVEVTPMQADWTLPDAEISDYLASFSRYGIPFNAVYGPGAPEGLVLPELLTSDTVMQAIEKASKK